MGELGVPDLNPALPCDVWLNKQYRFHDTKISSIVQHAYHMVAIDEHRTVFPTTLMQPSDCNATQIKQVWFVGDHGCIGGGTPEKKTLSNITFQWLVEQLRDMDKLGIDLDVPEKFCAGVADAAAPFQ